MAHFVQLSSAAASLNLLRQNRLKRHAKARLTRLQNLVSNWPHVGYRPVLPIIRGARSTGPQLRFIQVDSLI